MKFKLFTSQENRKDLNSCIFRSDLSGALILIQAGADINGKNDRGIRPIYSALNSENPKNLKFLIEQGADINIDFGAPPA
ncbi:hypothetical protein [Croceimicrobium sp.]|uniref:hypothetical protein n=1 Tax=Croceimicrobium sp. TaxID=2828340 RepID=UPI003BABBDFF